MEVVIKVNKLLLNDSYRLFFSRLHPVYNLEWEIISLRKYFIQSINFTNSVVTLASLETGFSYGDKTRKHNNKIYRSSAPRRQ
jgi:hypothetical protein